MDGGHAPSSGTVFPERKAEAAVAMGRNDGIGGGVESPSRSAMYEVFKQVTRKQRAHKFHWGRG